MTARNRFAVPMQSLDEVRVRPAEQVEEQRAASHPDAANWTASLVPAYGDGTIGAIDGDGD